MCHEGSRLECRNTGQGDKLKQHWSDVVDLQEDFGSKFAPKFKQSRATDGTNHTFKNTSKDSNKLEQQKTYIDAKDYKRVSIDMEENRYSKERLLNYYNKQCHNFYFTKDEIKESEQFKK